MLEETFEKIVINFFNKMCIKSALMCTKKLLILSLDMLLYALVLKLHNKFIPNTTFIRCSSHIDFFNHGAKFAPNIIKIGPTIYFLRKIA